MSIYYRPMHDRLARGRRWLVYKAAVQLEDAGRFVNAFIDTDLKLLDSLKGLT